MTTGSLPSAAAARLNPWRARHPLHEHVAPLGLVCALLLYALTFGADGDVQIFHSPTSSPQSWLKSEAEHALAAVHASMVELPREIEAAAVARLASKTQIVLLENRQLAAELRALQASYAELRHGHEAELAELWEGIHRTRSELLWLSSQQAELQDHLEAVSAQRHPVQPLVSPNLSHEGSDPTVKGNELARHVAEVRADAANTVGSNVRSESAPSPFTVTDHSAASFVGLVAMQIAHSLRYSQRQAMMSSEETAFIVDVDRRSFNVHPGGQPVLLDSDLNIDLLIASSELTGPRSGNIRFFPDGSSTGGRIDLELYGSSATVKVDWSTGFVTVDGVSSQDDSTRSCTEGSAQSLEASGVRACG